MYCRCIYYFTSTANVPKLYSKAEVVHILTSHLKKLYICHSYVLLQTNLTQSQTTLYTHYLLLETENVNLPLLWDNFLI